MSTDTETKENSYRDRYVRLLEENLKRGGKGNKMSTSFAFATTIYSKGLDDIHAVVSVHLKDNLPLAVVINAMIEETRKEVTRAFEN